MTLEQAINERLGAKFCARQWVEGEIYDCVTFVSSAYLAAGILKNRPEIPESYLIGGSGPAMRDMICEVVESTEAFMIGSHEPKHGDLLVFSDGERGHHAGIFLEGGRIAHCVLKSGVRVDSFVPPLSDHVFKIYRPKEN